MQRLGLSKANDALILSKRLSAQELLACGFLNRVYPAPADQGDAGEFISAVVADVRSEFLERGLNRESMLLVKRLVRRAWEGQLAEANVREAFEGMERFLVGAPQKEFAAVARGEKKHKL